MNPLSDHAQLLSSVRNALRILRSFTVEEPEKRITDLALTMGVAKSTAQRLVSTLVSEGFLRKNPETNRYRLGLSILTLSNILIKEDELYNEALPSLHKLVDNVGETAHIAVLDQLDVVYLLKEECNHPVRMLTFVGKRNPLHATSSGKVFLAFHDDDTLFNAAVQNGLVKYASNTITDPEVLKSHLTMVRNLGYAYTVNEFSEGVISIAAPIFDYTNKLTSSINIVGPIQRIDQMMIPMLAKKLIASAREISEKLGYMH